MNEIFADLHVHIGRSENGKPIKITAARSLNHTNITKRQYLHLISSQKDNKAQTNKDNLIQITLIHNNTM